MSVTGEHPVMYCYRCEAERRCSISEPHFCLSCGNYIDYFKDKGEKLVIDKKIITERMDRLRSPRRGSIFPRDFEAGMLYAYLTILDEEPEFEDTSAIYDWISDVFRKKQSEET